MRGASGHLAEHIMDDSRSLIADTYADQAISRMRSPREMHIICVDVTNKCDLQCSNCTRLLRNQTEFWDMKPENFRLALRSLRGFQGVIAMIGGNPCMHKQFAELCRIFQEEVPVKRQRGLWSNNVFDHQELIAETFGFFNLNPHNDERGRKSMEKLKKLIPQINYFNGHSHHAPLMTAMRDLYPNEQEMWDRIPSCDINKSWSATIIENQGNLRVYFCEVAASFDLARRQDHGQPVTEGWWNTSISQYSDQVKHFCPGCGVPARLKGHLDIEQLDTYTKTNADIAQQSLKKRRRILEIESIADVDKLKNSFVNYNTHHGLTDHGMIQRDGFIGGIYSQNGRYYCIPESENAKPAEALARITKTQTLPTFVYNLIREEDRVLHVGPGFSPDIVDLARKAKHVHAFDPSGAAVEVLTLTCRLNNCNNTKIEQFAAYDHNAVAEFVIAADPFAGMHELDERSVGKVSDASIEHANCIRIDDHFGPGKLDVLVMSIGGNGDAAALRGAEKTLAQANLLFLEFNHDYYSNRPEKLDELATILLKTFTECYAPQMAVKSTDRNFLPFLSHVATNKDSSCLLLSKVQIV